MTDQEFKELLNGYFAPPEKRSKMSQAEIKDVAKRLNKKINVPIVKETKEEKIIIKVVMQIDRFLYDNLPNEFYDLIRTSDRGITDKEAKRLVRRLTRLANKNIDIPYLPEFAEHFAIRFVIGIVVNSARKSLKLDVASDLLENSEMNVTSTPDDDELDGLVVSA